MGGHKKKGATSYEAVALEVPEMHMVTGRYEGDGEVTHSIDIGVNLLAAAHVYIIIKCIDAAFACHRIEYRQGDSTMQYENGSDFGHGIEGLSDVGFIVGDDARVNNFIYGWYRYVVFYEM